jgi:hypothetical protein
MGVIYVIEVTDPKIGTGFIFGIFSELELAKRRLTILYPDGKWIQHNYLATMVTSAFPDSLVTISCY